MKNRSALQLLLVSLVIGLVACQISVPMYSDQKVFLVNLTYGTDRCPVLAALMEETYNLLNSSNIPNQCGSTYIGKDYYETHYTSSFSMSGFEGVWNFTSDYEFWGYNRIALTSDQFNPKYHSSIIDSLYANGSIQSKSFFFNVNKFQQSSVNGEKFYELGSFQIGQPDLSLLENGSKLATMKSFRLQTKYVHIIEAKYEIRSAGETLKTEVESFQFDIYNPSWKNNRWFMGIEPYNALLNLWKQKGINFFAYDVTEKDQKICFKYLSQLSPIEVILAQEDGSDFIFTIEPEDYIYFDEVQKCNSFMFHPIVSASIEVGQKMLEKYYYGYDTSTYQTFLGKKSTTTSSANTKQAYNFRGSLQL